MFYYTEIKRINEALEQNAQDLRDAEDWAADGGESEFRIRMAEVQKEYDLGVSLRQELKAVKLALGESEALAEENDRRVAAENARWEAANPDLVPF